MVFGFRRWVVLLGLTTTGCPAATRAPEDGGGSGGAEAAGTQDGPDDGGTVDDGFDGSDADGSGSGGGSGSSTTDGNDTADTDDPVVCEVDPDAGPASFFLDLGELTPTVDEVSATIEGDCDVVSVQVGAGIIETELNCVVDGAGPYAIGVDMADAAGAPAWAAGEAVTLYADGQLQAGGVLEPVPYGGGFALSSASMRRASDSALLMAGANFVYQLEALLAPIEVVELAQCFDVEPCSGDEDSPLRFELREPGGAVVPLAGGEHVELPLADGTTLSIDAPYAHATSDCHFGRIIEFAARRMID